MVSGHPNSKILTAVKLASLSTSELLKAAAPGVFAGGGYGLASGLLNPGTDDRGERRSRIVESLKRALVGGAIGGTLTARYPQGIGMTENLMKQGLDAAGNTIRHLRDNTTGNEVESLIDTLLTGDR